MNTRSKAKAGRGHSRDEWTQCHHRIVQLQDKSGSRSRREKVAKLTSLLRERESISEHEREQAEATKKNKRGYCTYRTGTLQTGIQQIIIPYRTVRYRMVQYYNRLNR